MSHLSVQTTKFSGGIVNEHTTALLIIVTVTQEQDMGTGW